MKADAIVLSDGPLAGRTISYAPSNIYLGHEARGHWEAYAVGPDGAGHYSGRTSNPKAARQLAKFKLGALFGDLMQWATQYEERIADWRCGYKAAARLAAMLLDRNVTIDDLMFARQLLRHPLGSNEDIDLPAWRKRIDVMGVRSYNGAQWPALRKSVMSALPTLNGRCVLSDTRYVAEIAMLANVPIPAATEILRNTPGLQVRGAGPGPLDYSFGATVGPETSKENAGV